MGQLIEAFNANQIDLFYGINSTTNYALDTYNTVSVYKNDSIILKHSSNDKIINSIKSLSDVYCLENSKIHENLINNGISVKTFANMKDLMNNIDQNSIIALDLYNYNFYASQLDDYIISLQVKYDDYSFVIRDISFQICAKHMISTNI